VTRDLGIDVERVTSLVRWGSWTRVLIGDTSESGDINRYYGRSTKFEFDVEASEWAVTVEFGA